VRIRKVVRILLALLAATAVPALVIIVPYASATLSVGDDYGWLRTRNVSVLALGVSAAHVLVLGVPTFLALTPHDRALAAYLRLASSRQSEMSHIVPDRLSYES
jgi:hypothetical protein